MADVSWCEWVESILVFLCCWLLSVFDSHLPKKEKNCFLFSVFCFEDCCQALILSSSKHTVYDRSGIDLIFFTTDEHDQNISRKLSGGCQKNKGSNSIAFPCGNNMGHFT